MMLPSRADYLKTGLVPALSPSQDSDCPICTDELSAPVSLDPCSHNFCKPCITQWLTQPSRNTCPSCRKVLFYLDNSDKPPVRSNRMVLISQAMTHAGLLGGRYMRFSDEIHINIFELYRVAAQANLWLGEEFHRAAAGPAVLDRERFGVQVIAMENLVRGYAEAAGRGYTSFQRREWKVLVKALYKVIDKWNGRTVDAMVLPRLVKEEMRRTPGQANLIEAGFFEEEVRPGTLAADLDILLQYVAVKAAERYATRETQRIETMRRPTMWSKVGSWFKSLVH